MELFPRFSNSSIGERSRGSLKPTMEYALGIALTISPRFLASVYSCQLGGKNSCY